MHRLHLTLSARMHSLQPALAMKHKPRLKQRWAAGLGLFIGFALCTTLAIGAEEAGTLVPVSKKLSVVPVYARKLVPTAPDDLVCVDIDSNRYSILVYSKRKAKDQGLESDILVFDHRQNPPQLIYKAGMNEELYDPTIFSPPQWKSGGHPVIAITRQAGAAAAVTDLITFTNAGKVKELSRLVADRSDITTLKGAASPRLVLYQRADDSAMYLPKVMKWTGTDFEDSSAEHPEFYANFLEELSYKEMLDPENSIIDREVIARLLKLAGRREEAKALLVELLKEASAAPVVEKTVVGRLRTAVDQMAEGKDKSSGQ